MSSREERVEGKLSEIVRIGGYLVMGGALMGFSLGVYMLFNSALFSLFINISQYEAMSYFLGVFMPSFVIIIALGYLFATTLGLRSAKLSQVAPLSVLSLVCMVVSALSMFYFLSFLGSFLVLTAVVKAYAKPTFKALSRKEAFFLVEIGAILVACFSALLLLIWLISRLLQTYGVGLYSAGYQFVFSLLIVGALSFLAFFTIPLWGSRGTNAGLSGILGLAVTIASFSIIVQNQYVLFNESVYVGVFLAGLGLTLAFVGNLTYVKLFFSEPSQPVAITPSILYQGRYCPYCGRPRLTSVQTSCSDCGRDLVWRPEAPFCSSCGLLVPAGVKTCPHCQDDIWNKLVYFSKRDLEEKAVAGKLKLESEKKEAWIMKGAPKMLNKVLKALSTVERLIRIVNERLSLTFKESVYVWILTYFFTFVSFVAYKRIQLTKLWGADVIITYFGFPLEWLRVQSYLFSGVNSFVQIWWAQFLLDVAFYFLLSLALVYGASRLLR